MRSLQEDKYKWKLLHKRLLLSSKINYDKDTELHSQLKHEARWLKEHHDDVVILNKSNVYSKVAPSVKNCKENYNIFKIPSKDDVKLLNNESRDTLRDTIKSTED
jgi:hypothetical protein